MFRLFRRDKPFLPTLAAKDYAVLFGGIAAYVAIAMATITKFSIWFDEAFGSFLIRFNFADLTRYTANDVHPPLYYWLLKIWASLFGNTELGIRSMSVFFAVVTIIFVFLLVMKLFGRRAAYVSLLLLVLSPMFIRYGQEARMYTLLTAIVAAATYVLLYAAETKKRWAWVTYGVLIALGMLTQYFAALAWLAHLAWYVLATRGRNESFGQIVRRLIKDKNVLAGYGTSLLVFAFWVPFLVIQFLTIQGHGFWIKPVSTATIPDFLTNYLLFSDYSGATSWLALGFYALLIATIYTTVRLLKKLDGAVRSQFLLLLLLVIVPVVLLFLISMPPLRSAFVDRYLMTSVVFLSVFLGVSLVIANGILHRFLRIGMALLLVAFMTVGIINQANTGNYNRASGQSNNTRQLLEKVRAQASPGVPIIASSPWIFYEASIYNRADSPIYYVHETTQYKYGSLTALAENEQFKIRDLDAFTRDHPEFWVIGNLRDAAPKPLRASWQTKESIVVNDDLTSKPLFKATRFTLE